MKSIHIGKVLVGEGQKPFLIAEMSANHNGSLEKALAIVDAAAAAGASALKIQTYTADTMTLDLREREFLISDPNSLWTGKTLYELYREASTPWEWHEPIFRRCREHGLVGFSTPFDASAVDFLERLEAPCYKIASFENTDLPLIRRAASTGKPLILSTGMATETEIREAVDAARKAGCKDLLLLKCTSVYPAEAREANVLTIPDMRKRFDCPVGLSDHTHGIGVALAAVAHGAVAVEKHFILSREDRGVDSAFSMEPAELRLLAQESIRVQEALGSVRYEPTEKERKSLVFRRSLYFVKDLKAGEAITRENIRAIRPGLGLSPKYLDDLIGKRVRNEVTRGTPVQWELLQ